ncbi:hypothetical protein [Nonomuraea sp. 10N515B]|uniref:hypothetical protein n=1 Tax=Nonomuraea sp. 10N515B TaxID=3457422 RepID=UPI003FCDC1BA
MKRIQKIGAALAAATFVPLGSLAIPAPAQAAAAYLEARCNHFASTGNYVASLRAYYNSTSTHDIFNRLNWYSSGPGLQADNTVRIRIRKHRGGNRDQTLKSWSIKTRKGSGGRSIGFAVNRRDRIHVDLDFTFDLPRGVRLSCHKRGRSRSI